MHKNMHLLEEECDLPIPHNDVGRAGESLLNPDLSWFRISVLNQSLTIATQFPRVASLNEVTNQQFKNNTRFLGKKCMMASNNILQIDPVSLWLREPINPQLLIVRNANYGNNASS